MRKFRRLLVVIVTLVACSPAAQAATGDDYFDPPPLLYRNQNPVYLQFPNITPMPTAALPHGTGRVAITGNYSNIFEYITTESKDVRIDLEQLRLTVDTAYGLGNGFTLEGEIPLIHSGGGFLDPFINWFHNLFGFPDGGRGLFPQNDYAYRLLQQPTGVPLYQVGSVPLGLGDIVLRLRHEAVAEGKRRPALGTFLVAELPTGRRSRGLGNGRFDYGFGLLMEKSSKRWHGYLNVGYFVTGGHADLDQFINTQHLAYVVSGAFNMSRQVAVHAQIHGGTPLLTNMETGRWDGPPLDLIIGFSGEHPLGQSKQALVWQVGFAEDLNANGPSIDFTALLQLGLKWNRATP